jgi:hypothetical protein
MQNIALDKLMFFCTSDSQTAYYVFQSFMKNTLSTDIPNYKTSASGNFFIYFKNGVVVFKDYSSEKGYSIRDIAIQFLDAHPVLNEENKMLAKKQRASILKLFSLKKDKNIDKDIQKWNWGAFAFGGIYGFFNNYSWIFLIAKWSFLFFITEVLGSGYIFLWLPTLILIHFFAGYNGSKVAWLSKRWEGKEYFNIIQSKWNIAGKIATIIATVVIIIFYYYKC